MLLLKLLQDCIEGGVRVFDFTVGDESFKERFANVKHENVRIEIGPQRRRGFRGALREDLKRHVKGNHPELFSRLKEAQAQMQGGASHGLPIEGISTRAHRAHLPLPRAPFEVSVRVLWRARPLQPVPSEFSAQWARYSHLKALTRREGLKPDYLVACLERMRRGERAVVASWPDRPVALLWIAREADSAASAAGVPHEFPAGAALVTDSYLALDLRGSPRRETLPPTLLTFLAAEGITALYGLSDTRHAPPLLDLCGVKTVPMARYTEVRLFSRRFGFHKRFDGEGN